MIQVILGLLVFFGGCYSLYYGITQNNSFEAQANSFFSGSTNPGTPFIVLGSIAAAIGIALFIWGVVSIMRSKSSVGSSETDQSESGSKKGKASSTPSYCILLTILGGILLVLGAVGLIFCLTADFSKIPSESMIGQMGEAAPTVISIVSIILAFIGIIMLVIGLANKGKITTLQLVESALMVAVAVVLNELLKIPSPLGGGVTVVSMLPLVLISHRHGAAWGFFTAFVFSLIELIFGLKNVGYAESTVMAVGIIFLDYILAYSIIGLSGIFGKSRSAVAIGIAVTFTLRFISHWVAGAWIWGVWMPDEYMGMTMTNPWIYSALYNGWYMAAELVLTELVAMLIYKPLEKYIRNEKPVKE